MKSKVEKSSFGHNGRPRVFAQSNVISRGFMRKRGPTNKKSSGRGKCCNRNQRVTKGVCEEVVLKQCCLEALVTHLNFRFCSWVSPCQPKLVC